MTAASNSEARKRAGAVASTCEHFYAWVSPAGSRHGVPICTSCGQPDPRWLNETMDQAASVQIPPLSQPIPAPVDPGAIGRLNEKERGDVRDAFDAWGHDYTLLFPVVESIVREYTERALAEVEQRIRAIDYVAELEHGDNGDWMRDEVLAIVRAARQEQGR